MVPPSLARELQRRFLWCSNWFFWRLGRPLWISSIWPSNWNISQTTVCMKRFWETPSQVFLRAGQVHIVGAQSSLLSYRSHTLGKGLWTPLVSWLWPRMPVRKGFLPWRFAKLFCKPTTPLGVLLPKVLCVLRASSLDWIWWSYWWPLLDRLSMGGRLKRSFSWSQGRHRSHGTQCCRSVFRYPRQSCGECWSGIL